MDQKIDNILIINYRIDSVSIKWIYYIINYRGTNKKATIFSNKIDLFFSFKK